MRARRWPRWSGARPAEVVFTSGATEANNAVLAGGWEAILLAGIEHDSVLAPARNLAQRRQGALVELPVDASGVVAVEAVADRRAASRSAARALLSLQLANNETGVVQPVAAAAEAGPRRRGWRCTPMRCRPPAASPWISGRWASTYLSLSAHKLGGPKGVGALVIRDGAGLPAFIAGGGQERRRRAGTENVPAIAGFGAAARAAVRDLATMDRVRALRDRVEAEIRAITPSPW